MAAEVTEASICNLALSNVGITTFLTALTDNSTNARVCSLHYPQVRDYVLKGFDWPFARKHQVLAQLTTTRSGWQYCYAWPSDCLAPRYIFNGLRPGAPVAASSPVANPWVAMWSGMPFSGYAQKIAFGEELSDNGKAKIIVTDQSAAELIYTAGVEAVTLFSPTFVELLVIRLTAKLFLSIVKSRPMHDQWMKLYESEIHKTQADAIRDTQEDPPRDAEAISVRG